MIDLRKHKLQDSIVVDGVTYEIKTNFKFWIDFGIIIEKASEDKKAFAQLANKFSDVFQFDIDELSNTEEALNEIIKFYVNANSTPDTSFSSPSSDIIVDYIEDGEYLYASFLQAYNIDLVEQDLHWHKFQALFRSLPEDTKMAQIMSYRSYTNDKTKPEKRYEKLKRIWSLKNKRKNIKDKQILDEINKEFYGC